MASEMIERMTRAMCPAAIDFDCDLQYWTDKAQVAARTMREPTEAMVNAAESLLGPSVDVPPYVCRVLYRAMIVAALTED